MFLLLPCLSASLFIAHLHPLLAQWLNVMHRPVFPATINKTLQFTLSLCQYLKNLASMNPADTIFIHKTLASQGSLLWKHDWLFWEVMEKHAAVTKVAYVI